MTSEKDINELKYSVTTVYLNLQFPHLWIV